LKIFSLVGAMRGLNRMFFIVTIEKALSVIH